MARWLLPIVSVGIFLAFSYLAWGFGLISSAIFSTIILLAVSTQRGQG
ncbi:hypothetical protein [Thermococcus sp.]|nr:hypothetical protein [Thermococcus sp.]